MSIATWTISPSAFHLSCITILFLVTWLYSLKGQFLIDDEEGIKQFSDRNQFRCNHCGYTFTSFEMPKECPNQACRKPSNFFHEKIDWYEMDRGNDTFRLICRGMLEFQASNSTHPDKKRIRIKNTAFNPYIGFPGSIVRWMRLNLGKMFKVIGKNTKGHEVYGYVQDPFRHHIISLTVHLSNCVLLYLLLARLIGPDLAFTATLLFTAHPVSAQVVAWISGIGYLSSLLFALLSFHSLFWFHNLYLQIGFSSLFTFISMSFLLSGMANWTIFALLGQWWIAGANLLIAIIGLFTQGKIVWSIRSNAFKEQQMGRNTVFTWRRPILMIKCFYYYCTLILFPKRLGLFHTWGYHFDEKLQRFDWMFWKGVSCILLVGVAFWFGPLPIKLGLIWLVAYLCLFLNVITAQQFVVDRYCFLSSVGYAIILATLFQAYPIIFALLLGVYLMRTLVHLPTFLDLKHFYKSNIFNFPDSEVAYGNLGVTYINEGKSGSAIDVWNEAIAINPHYDVPHYNLYSIFKGAKNLDAAFKHLELCLNSKTVHFPKQWTDEMEEMKKNLPINDQINQMADYLQKGSYGKH